MAFKTQRRDGKAGTAAEDKPFLFAEGNEINAMTFGDSKRCSVFAKSNIVEKLVFIVQVGQHGNTSFQKMDQ